MITREDNENPFRSPNSSPLPAREQHWWRADVSPKVLAIIFLFGVLQYWMLGLLFVYGFVNDVSHVVLAFESYFAHWSSMGGLIGFAASRKRVRGGLIGAAIGLILAAGLMA